MILTEGSKQWRSAFDFESALFALLRTGEPKDK